MAAGSGLFQTMWDKFPDMSAADVGIKIGGKVQYNIETATFNNVCAIRASYALNRAGCKIPFEVGETVSGYESDDEERTTKRWHYYRIPKLQSYLQDSGLPDSVVELDSNAVKDIPGNLAGKTGLVFFHVAFSDASGHAALWNGERFRGEMTRDDYSGIAHGATFLELN